jgi:RNA methyltransferase, TrmH family
MTITSPHNERLKEIRKLARTRERALSGRFVAEGEDLLAAAEQAGWPALERYCAAGGALGGPGWVEVEPALLASVSQLGSGTRALGVFAQRWAQAPAGPLCVALHGIADPGNVGAILRSALAFGASCVALGPGCADPYGFKAVRASMGALFAVPLARYAAVEELPGATVALDAHAEEPIAALGIAPAARLGGAATPAPAAASAGPLAPAGPLTLLVGAERAGLPGDVLAACDRVVRIPIASESLNAAMAATVALYEVTRGAVAPDHRMAPA